MGQDPNLSADGHVRGGNSRLQRKVNGVVVGEEMKKTFLHLQRRFLNQSNLAVVDEVAFYVNVADLLRMNYLEEFCCCSIDVAYYVHR